MEPEQKPHGFVNYTTYVLVWLGLLAFTGLTVTLAGFHFGSISVFLVLLVAAVKSTLVLYYFMHLKYEKPLFRNMVFIAIIALAIFIGLTFVDILFR